MRPKNILLGFEVPRIPFIPWFTNDVLVFPGTARQDFLHEDREGKEEHLAQARPRFCTVHFALCI